MPLRTLEDLKVETSDRAWCIEAASRLHVIWTAWKAQDHGTRTIAVEFRGERTRAAGLHASELSGCQRKLVLALMGTKRQVQSEAKDVAMQRRFDMGTMAHALIQREFHEMCAWYNSTQTDVHIVFQDEVSIHPGLGGLAERHNAHSSCDGCFSIYIRQENRWVLWVRVGLEIKTASDGEFVKLKEAKKEHQEQTCFYMTMLDIPLMWTLYVNKNNQQFTPSETPFLQQYDELKWTRVLHPRILKAEELAAMGKLPVREEGMQCGWCPFAWKCQPDYLKRGQLTSAPLDPRAL